MIYKNPNTIIIESSLIESNIFEKIDNWSTHNQNHCIQIFKSNSIKDSDYEKLKENINVMRTSEDYFEYKRAFDRFCYFCHIVPRGVILKTYDLEKGDEPNKNSLMVEYSYNTKKINLPDDAILYHMTKVEGLTELNPYFRGKQYLSGKTKKGYMYDKSRIYFTLRKHMPKFMADYKGLKGLTQKLHIYKCKEKIKSAYVDPLLWTSLQGAIYIETTRPIRVEEITSKLDILRSIPNKLSSANESTNIDFNNLFNFVIENGLILDDDTI